MKPTEQKRPSPQEVLRALADGKVVETEKGHYSFDGEYLYFSYPRRSYSTLVSWEDMDLVMQEATRIIERPIATATKRPDEVEQIYPREPEPRGTCTLCEGHCNPEDGICPACCEYQMELKNEREKAKDELLKDIALVLLDVMGILYPTQSALLEKGINKAFPEES